MAAKLSQLESSTIVKGLATAQVVLDTIKPALDRMNAIYDSANGAKTTITQAALDAEPSLSGLTKQQLDDGMFALTATLKGAIDSAESQLEQLAARTARF